MSQHHSTNPLNANLVALVLIATFVISIGLILANSSLIPEPAGSGEGVEVARADSTETPLPSSTPVPPTPAATPLPTNTPVPAIATTEPQSLTITSTAQTADTGLSAGSNAAVSYDPALVEQGKQLFLLCSACHGPEARGLPNLGKDLVTSTFVADLTDEDLLVFIKTGRPIWDPLNTTGIDMPPKGGNPALADDEILAIIAYLRSLSASNG